MFLSLHQGPKTLVRGNTLDYHGYRRHVAVLVDDAEHEFDAYRHTKDFAMALLDSSVGSAVTSAPSRAGFAMIIDPDPDAAGAIGSELKRRGLDMAICGTAAEALRAVRQGPPTVLVLELALPDMDGFELVRTIRDDDDLPIVVVSTIDGEAERIRGLELGADDYVSKSCSALEVGARVCAVLRRVSFHEAATTNQSRLQFDRLLIDRLAREVIVDGLATELTAREFELLLFLADSPRRVFSSADLLVEVWGSDPEWQSQSTVAEHVHRLRRKIEIDPSKPRWIRTSRGAGYRFVP